MLNKLGPPGGRLLPYGLIAVAVLLSASITVIISVLHGFLDIQVYRVGAQTWLHHGDLYGQMPAVAAGMSLPFTYPPSAAVLMTPLAVVPLRVAEQWVTATSLGCLGVTIWLVLSRIRPDLDPRTKAGLTSAAVVVLSLIEPVRLTFWFGQVNLVLMAAVALDCLTVKPRWPRGLLVGVAAATKLTPAAFVLYFLIRKDWKAAGTATATTAAIVLSGFLLSPAQSRQYWLHTVTDTSRIGEPDYVGNQSIKAMVIRLGLPHSMSNAVWLGLSLAVLCVGAALMRRLFKAEEVSGPGGAGVLRGRPMTLLSVTALLVNAAILLLVSPVSWTHHWVWIAPALVTAGAWIVAHPARARFATVAGFATLFLIGPGLVPNGQHRELTWSWWQHLAGNAYILATCGLLAVGLIRLRRLRSLDPSEPSSVTSNSSITPTEAPPTKSPQIAPKRHQLETAPTEPERHIAPTLDPGRQRPKILLSLSRLDDH